MERLETGRLTLDYVDETVIKMVRAGVSEQNIDFGISVLESIELTWIPSPGVSEDNLLTPWRRDTLKTVCFTWLNNRRGWMDWRALSICPVLHNKRLEASVSVVIGGRQLYSGWDLRPIQTLRNGLPVIFRGYKHEC